MTDEEQIIIVIDTNVLVKAFRDYEMSHLEVIHWKDLKLGCDYDSQRIILGEYEKNVGRRKHYQKWFKKLIQTKKIYQYNGQLDKKHCTKLGRLGCHQPSDQVFIAVASRAGKVLISEDSDVGKGPKGHLKPHCDALKYLNGTMGISVYAPNEFLDVI